jgi:hypothetical protein
LTSSLEAEAFSTLKAGTVTKKVIRFGDVELPPIVSGVMQDTDLRGNPSERNVKMIAVRREHIDALLAAVARDHAKLGAMVAEGWLIEGSLDVNQALGNLRTVTAVLGRWRDEHRLNLH